MSEGLSVAAALDSTVAPTVVVRTGGIVEFDGVGKTAQPLVQICNELIYIKVFFLSTLYHPIKIKAYSSKINLCCSVLQTSLKASPRLNHKS